MAIIGSINGYGDSLTGIISSAEYLGGQVVGMRGLKGDAGADGQDGTDGQDGADGFSPIANVTKVGDTATITITDANGTTTATVSDGVSGGGGFIAVYGTTSFEDAYSAFNSGESLICKYETRDGDYYLPLTLWDSDRFIFKNVYEGQEYVAELASDRSPAWQISVTQTKDVFIAAIDDTTYLEISNAQAEGKAIYCLYEYGAYDYYLPLTRSGSGFAFTLTYNTDTFVAYVDTHDSWESFIVPAREIYQATYNESSFEDMETAIGRGMVVACYFTVESYQGLGGYAFSYATDLGHTDAGSTNYIFFSATTGFQSGSPKVYYFYASQTDGGNTYWSSIESASALRDAELAILHGKQDALVSGTNIKTINNTSLLGSGNITVTGSDTTYTLSIANNVITLTGSDSSTSSVTLPVYNGGVI